MTDVIKSIDWNQIGPFTALLLIVAILGLAVAPMIFKWLFKREDASTAIRKRQMELDADDRKRAAEERIAKDQALLGFVKTTGEAVQQIGIAMRAIEPMLLASETRVTTSLSGKIDDAKNELKVELVALRNEIDDKKQARIQADLNALKSRPSKP